MPGVGLSVRIVFFFFFAGHATHKLDRHATHKLGTICDHHPQPPPHGRWPMVTPGGGVGRYARPAVPPHRRCSRRLSPVYYYYY
eukprot:6181925-Prymnesium_polylepis.1